MFRDLAAAFIAMLDRPDNPKARRRFLDAAAKLDAALLVPDAAGDDAGDDAGDEVKEVT